jgi:phosphoglycolate phosphatase
MPRFDLAAVRAVVFDLDGTLLDSYAAIHDSLNFVLRAFGRSEVSVDETRMRVGHGLDALIARSLGPTHLAEGVRLFRERYETVGPAKTRLLPGAEEVTRVLKDRGFRLAVASNKPAFFSRQLLSALGVADRFGFVGGPDDGFPPKPAPDMVFMAVATLGVTVSQALLVGDMPIDVATARAAGMPVVVVPTGSSTLEELQATRPDVLIPCLADLMHLLPGTPMRSD